MKPFHDKHWVNYDVVIIIFIALLIRLATFNGAIGSDDLVYFGRALELSNGIWTSADYNGALRYGFNIPAGILMSIFGSSLFSANLWSLTCSLIEIGVVYLFAKHAINRRTGIFAALLLTTAPLHIAVATRIHADPVVSLFVTLSFALLYFGAIQKNKFLLFFSGISIGLIFWTKELAAVTWLAFLPLFWLFRRQWRSSIYVFIGLILMMLLHGLLMFYIAGDPLHLVKVVTGAVNRNFINTEVTGDGPFYYFKYLFFDIRHIGLLTIFALLSFKLFFQKEIINRTTHFGISYALIWFLGLLFILSFFPVSLHPLRFPMKQSNYISLFIAPIAILGAFGLSTLPRLISYAALILCMLVGITLGALQQADYRNFASNSKAVANFSLTHPNDVIFGSTNNSSLGNFWANQISPGLPHANIISFRSVQQNSENNNLYPKKSGVLYAVLDRQTMNWFAGGSIIVKPLPCWEHVVALKPEDLGLGNNLAGFVKNLLQKIEPLASILNNLSSPLIADIYRVSGNDVLCR